MTKLGQAAAIATIVGAIFTVATFLNTSDKPIGTDAPSASSNIGKGQIDPIASEDNELRPTAITESGLDVSETEIRTRFDAARKIPATSSRSSALQRLAKKASNLGFFSSAFMIASEIPSTSMRSITLSYVAKKAANSGDLELAIRIAETIPGTSIRSQTLSEISKI